MFTPSHFRVQERAALEAFIAEHSFGMLCSTRGGQLEASHLPFLIDRERGVLRAHMARANPQWQGFDGVQEALAVFRGPHAYVSPAWYEALEAVPTWNYEAVHVYGRARLIEAPAQLRGLLYDLVAHFESGREKPWSVPGDGGYQAFFARMTEAIVGFEIPLERVIGKAKLSQNRPEADRRRVRESLAASPSERERALAERM